MARIYVLILVSYILIGLPSFAADPLPSDGDDGYRLWLKYEPVTDFLIKSSTVQIPPVLDLTVPHQEATHLHSTALRCSSNGMIPTKLLYLIFYGFIM